MNSRSSSTPILAHPRSPEAAARFRLAPELVHEPATTEVLISGGAFRAASTYGGHDMALQARAFQRTVRAVMRGEARGQYDQPTGAGG
jgi:hypothetical protein